MAPEYSKAAKGLHPLVPLYAVDCDDEGNKRLCADQVRSNLTYSSLFPVANLFNPQGCTRISYSQGMSFTTMLEDEH